jgi:hypothetical protein
VREDCRVHEEVPREHRQQREGEHVDPLRRPDPIDRKAGGERDEHDDRPDPRPPSRGTERTPDRTVRR